MIRIFPKIVVACLFAATLPGIAQAKPMDANAAAQLVRSKMQGWTKSGKLIGGAAVLYMDGNAQIITAGRKDIKGEAPDAHTLFAIGSITKVFTAAMLAKLVNEGKVKLSEPVDKFLPSYTHLRRDVKGKLTFERLATFTASLPDGAPARIKTAKEYFGKYLSKWRPRWPIGSKDKYSDQSYEILAYLVPRVAGTDYLHMLSSLITGPLDMPDTLPVAVANPDQNRAISYQRNGKKFPYKRVSWDGVGYLYSTPADMQNFLEACLGVRPGTNTLQKALQTSWRPYFRMKAGVSQGFAWVIRHVKTHRGAQVLILKNGGVGGFFAYIVFDQTNKSGIVFMTNRNSKTSPHVSSLIEGLANRVLTGR